MKQAFNKKFAITLTGLSVISILLFTMCESERNNPLDAHASNFVPPSITIDTSSTNIGDGDTISTDSAKITVTGNRSECIFQASIGSITWTPWQSSGEFVFDSLSPGMHSVTIETKYDGFDVVVSKVITFYVLSPKSSSKALTSFSFASPAVAGTITESAKTVTVTVPYATEVTALVATFNITGVTAKVDSKAQVSDTTPNNFTKPVIYRVTAADSSYQDYTVKVEVSSNTAKAITAFSFTNSTSTIIDTTAKTITVNVPFSTDVSAIVPTLSHSGVSVSPASGAAQNFTNNVTYTVTAADKSIQVYVVSVNVAPNTAKAITAFSFTNSTSTIIDTTAKTVVVNVPFSTDVSALVPTLSHSGASVSPASGAAQNFTNAVTYTVTAADKSIQAYVVSVNVAPNTAKAITAFSFTNSTFTIIDTTAKTVVVNVPFSTDVSAIAPTLSHSGASVSPASGAAQNFTNAVTYTVTAADKSVQAYVVNVNVAPNTAKAITAFSFTNSTSTIIDTTAKTITVNVPFSTDVSALVPTLSHSGVSVSPASGAAHDFTNGVTYTVTAADMSIQAYVVSVKVAPNTAKAITAFSFTNSTSTIIDTTAKTITVNVPFSTDVSAIVPTLSHSGASVSPASGAAQNFTNAVTYAVTAADKSIQAYVVSVNVTPNTAKAITAFSFTNSTSTIIDTTAKTIVVKVPFNTDVSALVPTLSHSGASVSPASGAAQNFTNAVTYAVTAADKSIQAYVVSVNVSSNTSKAITAFSFTNSTSTIIDTLAKTIVVNVPFSTNVSALVPTLSHSGVSVIPASGAAQNFTNGVTYTVTAADKSIQSYVVTVTFAPYTFTVTFDGQNATVGPSPSTKTVTAPATTVVTLPTDPQRGGYRFDGWYTGTNGGGVPFVGSTNVTQTLPVFAKWTPVYTVTYNGNGSTVTVPVDANKYQNGQIVAVLSGITRTDYTFAGWNTQANGLGANYLFGNTFAMGSVNVELYAKWQMNQPVFTTQPESKTAPVNDSVTFTISASGVNLGYQWQKNNVDIINATAASYTTPVAIADTLAATYKCVVSNAGGNVPSSGATLAVSTVSDASGNVYHQVRIGNQVWTMENLRTTKYNDNTDIPKDTSAATWGTGTYGKFCYYGNTTNTDSIKKYGTLYNWYAVAQASPNIAPLGWHVPADAEWDTLQNWLIVKGHNYDGLISGNKIAKSMAAKTDWVISSNTGAIGNSLATNNKSGFSALGGGFRYDFGTFSRQSYYGYWWSATAYTTTHVWYRSLSSSAEYLGRDGDNKSCGFSLRLVRD